MPTTSFQLVMLMLAALSLQGVAGAATPAEPQAPGLWDRTRDMVGRVWRDTLEAVDGQAEQPGFAELWREVVPRLDHALTLEDRRAELPESSWIGEDQASNQREIDALLDGAVDLLTVSPDAHYRQQIRSLRGDIRRLQIELAEYRQRRVAAPHDSLWEKTVADYDAAIAAHERQIQTRREKLAGLRHQFAAELRNMGLSLDDDQLEFLLSTVVGDDLVDMSIAFDNVKRLTAQLEQLVADSGEDLPTARRYYGMYTVLLRVLDRMHQRLLKALDDDYLPRLDAIASRTRALVEQTRKLQQRSATGHDALTANLASQALTLRAAHEYRGYLVAQRSDVAAARSRLQQDLAVAVNTYETVKVSAELVDLIRSSSRMLATVQQLQVPALRGFQSLEMQREFERLTRELQAKGT